MKIKILQKTAGMNAGGIEKFLIGLSTNIDRDRFQVDFYLNTDEKQFYSKKIEINGGRIFYPNLKGEIVVGKPQRLFRFWRFLRTNSYDIVHINESLLASAVYGIIAKCAGVNKIIIHAHNDHSRENFSFLIKVIYTVSRMVNSIIADYYFGCSSIAANWFFSKYAIQSKKYFMIANGIDVNNYKFIDTKKRAVRKSLGIQDDFLVGHVGRFFEQKNHSFLIEIFLEIQKINGNSKLLLVGDGPLRKDIEVLVEHYGLGNKVIFYGISSSVADLMQAMDCFVFPSYYEGLGIVVVEAQASGLPTFCSDTLPNEAKIIDVCKYIDLNKGARYWAHVICENTIDYIRKDTSKQVSDAGFDIYGVTKWLEDFYEKINEK